ncbi:MAG TPA: DUF4349 domain-containing protein [Actinomycetales bacterium]|nr:DUF4349 domain-containing protein [Actinomycetales bacterium]
MTTRTAPLVDATATRGTRRRTGRTRSRRTTVAVLAAGLALGVLAGCAGAGGSGSDSAQKQAVSAPEPALGWTGQAGGNDASAGGAQSSPGAGEADSGSTADGGDSSAAGVSAAALQQRRQIRTGQLTVQVKDVQTAVSSARSFATAAQGYVSDEKTSTRPMPPDVHPVSSSKPGTSPSDVPSVVVDQSVLTLRVPQQQLDDVMDQVGGLGSVSSRSQSSQDVTDTYVDTSSRVKSQRASVERIRTLLSRASSIGDVVRLESELSRREADLDSLEARLASLDDSTTLATLVVTFSRPDAETPAAPGQGGFVGGLHDGWHALGASAAVVLRVVGAVLPFALVLALVGVPVWLAVRRRRTSTPPASASVPTGAE